jgi:hypothetical protein
MTLGDHLSHDRECNFFGSLATQIDSDFIRPGTDQAIELRKARPRAEYAARIDHGGALAHDLGDLRQCDGNVHAADSDDFRGKGAD